MSDIPFNPVFSTNEVYRENDQTRFLTTDLDAIDAAIAALQSGKANVEHTHSGYAPVSHTHDEYSPVSHTHSLSAIIGLLDMLLTAENGDIKTSFTGKDVLVGLAALPSGMHTAYAPVNATNSPKATESWRFLVHKTGSPAYGWVLAFGSYGSIFSNYLNNGTWRGWETIYDSDPVALWTGGYYMTAGHTVTPSKPLSKCMHGWVLVWSDYDTANSAAVNSDVCTTVIPKKNCANANWSGQAFLATVPANITETSDGITLKKLYVHDTKIVGYASNNVSPRNDVVLRAVYEF